MTSHDQAEGVIVAEVPEPVGSGVALLFAPGSRPSAEEIDGLLAGLPVGRMLSVSHRAEADLGDLELLCRGLSFDLQGLAPARSAAVPVVMQRLGLDDDEPQLEAVTLMAGRHLEGGAHLLPVLRTHLDVALALTGLPGLKAVIWARSGVMMSPEHFARIVGGWLEGGPFPVPGLVALLRDAESGLLSSYGLSFFTPRQVRVEGSGEGQAEVAAALIGRLVDGDGHVPAWITDSEGGVWNVSWVAEQGLVTARRSA
jgi:hypothetical protein